MPLARYPASSSPHLYACPRNSKDNGASQDCRRKSSLTKSLQAFARNTFHRRQRHTNAGDSSYGTTPATSFTSSPCPPSPGVSQLRSEGAMAPVTHTMGRASLIPWANSRDQTQTLMGVTSSVKDSPGLNGKPGSMDLQQPGPEEPSISHKNPSELRQTNGGKQRVKCGTLKEGRAQSQVSRIPLPSPQLDRYPRRNTNAGLPLPKSTTFSSFSSLRHGSSLSHHQSRSKNKRASHEQSGPEQQHQQQKQIGGMRQKPTNAANAQIAQIANNPPAGSFGSQHCFSPKQQPLLGPKGRSLPKSLTAINLASYSKLPGYSAPTESFINRYQRNARSKYSIFNDCEDTASLRSFRGRNNPPDAAIKDACVSDLQQPTNLREQRPMEELISPCPSPNNGDDIQTVTTAQPRQYWLGRFSTLVNAFHHEDSFKEESDAATGYDSSAALAYYYITSSSTATLNDQRAKRAFDFLENACSTAEARVSFLEFRDAYSRCFGNRWSKWFVRDAGVGADAGAAGGKQGYRDSTADLSDGTLISDREVADRKRKWSEGGTLTGGGIAGAGGIGLMNMFRTVRKSLA
ncbi:hypothetical protein BDDG_07846 [Blastomyces dermatitidis ATCC 18188]|uniref:Uncharacterized protein n=1 Tax=Ajellomyces dermatitidis (strain ATCC 18188 / CBS 674.68) TaxID=653446 RepID=F2TNT8_AJEDA|nr:hypothetical protein BDDG_07846 [Blastomyces dermatitidis ATCC 18188]